MTTDAVSLSKAKAGFFLMLPLLTFFTAALPVIYLTFLVLRYAVPIPVLDDWEMTPLIVKAQEGTLRLYDLFEQQQEARTFFPKILFILFAAVGRHWDGRVEMIFSIFICCLTALGILFLLRKALLSGLAKRVAFLLMVLLIFSPVQQELWLLASGFPSFLPALCLVWGIWVIRTRISVAAKFWICLAVAVFSSFSLANGLLAWGLTFPLLFVLQPVPGWKKWLCGWFLACAICSAIYFWGFKPQDELPTFAPAVSPLAYLQYLLAFLGSGLARAGNEHPLAASTAVGAVLLAGYLGTVIYSVFRRRDREYCERILPWLALGAYSIGSGCLAALGRIGWGVSQALESRYVPFSLYLIVAMIALGAIFTGEVRQARGGFLARRLVFASVVFLSAGYLVLELMCAAASVPLLRMRSAEIRLGQGAVLFSQVMDTSDTIRSANYPRPTLVRQRANVLDRLHLLRTPLIRTNEISKLRRADVDEKFAAGWFDGLVKSDESHLVAWGWAAFPGKGRSADSVVLAYADERGEWIVFAASDAVFSRPDVAENLKNPEQRWTGWRAVFTRDAIPKGAKLSAWAVDAKAAKLYRLKTTEQPLNF
jgi:hypothetical protein